MDLSELSFFPLALLVAKLFCVLTVEIFCDLLQLDAVEAGVLFQKLDKMYGN